MGPGRLAAAILAAALVALAPDAGGLAGQEAEPRDTVPGADTVTAADTVAGADATPVDTIPPADAGPGDATSPFAPLDLLEPDSVRTAAGAPGPAYWQQRADYEIRVTLDPRQRRLSGSETIRYRNQSPDTLRALWLQLDQNLFDPSTWEARQVPEEARFSGAFEGGGFHISEVALLRDAGRIEVRRGEAPEPGSLRPDRPVGGPDASGADGPAGPGAGGDRSRAGAAGGGAPPNGPVYRIDGTIMQVALDEPLPPGGEIGLAMDFAFAIPENGADRMGWLNVDDGTVYEIAQWYPRMFVYDDVRGWNVLPFLGQGEFYLEYGTFDVEITVPREFLVMATGELRNPEAVLTAEQRERLEEARGSEETVTIVSRDEVGDRETRPSGTGPLTWRFRAEDVRDFAWAASQAFIWDAAGVTVGADAEGEGGRDVLVMSAYPEEGLPRSGFGWGWERSTQIVRHSVEYYSQKWRPYPYPVAINVAGRALGMEYPMIVFCTVQARAGGLFLVTDHEIGHGWFPMLVGSDERRHAWMDEGLVTFMGFYSLVEFTGERPVSDATYPEQVARRMRSEIGETPVYTMADSIAEAELGFLAYEKPAAVLILLREYVLGPDRFDQAFQAYIDRWAERHPYPADFFRTMEDLAGEDLDWFWRGWILSASRLDQAVAGVDVAADSTVVTIENQGEVVMPLEVRLVFDDGTDECRRFPVEVWRGTDVFRTVVRDRDVRNVHVDPRGVLPDVDRNDNIWGRGVVVRQETCAGWGGVRDPETPAEQAGEGVEEEPGA